MPKLRVLHLVGSAQDDFHGDLSRLYAQSCLTATADTARYEYHIAYVTPDCCWRFPVSLSDTDIAAAEPMYLADAIATLEAKNIDVALPQMFCIPGMTQYRSLLDLIGIPYAGNAAEVMTLTADKAKTKAIVAAAGIKVPYGELLRPGDMPTLRPPVVIKPTNADNSMGVTFVDDMANYDAALANAFRYASEVLVETYIELGREVRCGILCQGDRLVGLPLEEYGVSETDHPIRGYADKLKRDASGTLGFAAKEKDKSWIVTPTDPITERVHAIAKQCHQALGCRHYSLFDFRIDAQGQPWFLEAGLYCSFSPYSVVSTMARAADMPLPELLRTAIAQALSER
ncbi:MAG: D-alanine--D-alanine ligase [Cyanobacteria bacterium J06626_18]